MRTPVLALLTLTLAACPAREVTELLPVGECTYIDDVPVSLNRDLDLLFVIDNSGSMAEEQASLAANFPRFIDKLSTAPGGLPNVHIGVVSTDVGIGGYAGVQFCDKNGGKGDDGLLQNTPRVPGCTPPSGFFIKDITLSDGSPDRNYTGTLEDTFACIARLGTSGCGFEQPLESMKRALDGHLVQNTDFLRPTAFLGVVLITDEDDCSARDATVFDPSQTGVDAPLGPLDSFRCTEFGVRAAGGAQPIGRAAATYADTVPCDGDAADGCYLQNPQAYVDFLRDLKPTDPDDLVLVAGIFGDPAPFRVEVDPEGAPALAPSCGAEREQPAAPGVRLDWFVDQYPGGTFTSICEPDLAPALERIAASFVEAMVPCVDDRVDLEDILLDEPGLQPACQVVEVTAGVETVMPRCRMIDGETPDPPASGPCWYVRSEPAQCGGTGLAFAVAPEGRTAPPDARLAMQCRVRAC